MTSIAEQVGRVVGGRYRLLAPVGAGASSHVYAASDTRLGRRVAVKLLHPMLAVDSAFLRRFQAEARLAASLDHPHVMRVFDWGEEEAGPYLVLEYLGGGSLRALLDTGVLLSHSQAAEIGRQAASGLAYAHRRGVVHRDIKPGNLLFDDEGHLRIADFGVARALAESALTEPLGAMVGTARYASPEQAEGRPLDDRTDVYSLALVLYEGVSGQVPFARETITGTLMARVGATLPPSGALGPLAPILAAAAIPQPLARLDAASASSHLELLCRQLPPPAPIPLDRIVIRYQGGQLAELDPTNLAEASAPNDVTLFGLSSLQAAELARRGGLVSGAAVDSEAGAAGVLGASGADLAAGGSGAAGAGLAAGGSGAAGASRTFAAPPAPAGGGGEPAGDGSSSPTGAEGGAAKGPRRHRWWRWLLAVLLLLVAAGAGTLAVMRYDIYAHVVPAMEGQPLSAAEASANHAGLAAEATLRRYDSAVPAGRVIWQSIGQGRHERRGTVIDLSVSLGARPVPVPELAGKTVAAALGTLRVAHLLPGAVSYAYTMSVKRGDVISWADRGRTVVPGKKIAFVVSAGPPFERFSDLSRLPYSEAAASLERLHLRPIPRYDYSRIPRGAVISTNPPAGRSVREGSAVTVNISRGPPMTTVPPLIGLTVGAAEQALASHHLRLVTIYGPSVGIVIYSSPPSGDKVDQGSAVALWVA